MQFYAIVYKNKSLWPKSNEAKYLLSQDFYYYDDIIEGRFVVRSLEKIYIILTSFSSNQ
jgi:hypothetical protein